MPKHPKRPRDPAQLAKMIVVPGCVQPGIMSANERGGIIEHANGTNEASAFSVADAYCQRHGLIAQITGTDVLYNHVMFACVE